MSLNLLASNIVTLSHEVFKKVVKPGDTVVDATCGNGKDSLQLAKLLDGRGRLIMYDIQSTAIENTQLLLSSHLTDDEQAILEFKLLSHEYISEKGAKLFHYNLGYLPKSNKEITTLTSSTLVSIQKALSLLAPQGCVSVVCYPGHQEGAEETVALENLASTLSSQTWQVNSYTIMNRKSAPRLLLFQSLEKHASL